MGVIIVTGGSRGIGAAICRKLAAQGYKIVVNYTSDSTSAEAVAKEVDGLAVRADVSAETDVKRMFDAAEQLGTLTGVVCNAAITGNTPGRLDEQSVGTVREVFDTNVIGVFLCNKEAVLRMSTKYGHAGGGIVNISSTAAGRGSPGEWVHYAATKGAVETLTHGLALEVADEGIRVNAIAPGLVETGMHAAAGMPDRTTRLAPLIPMKRPGQPAEIAEGVAWLLSGAASFVTGAVLPISGGR
jgi:NAD(P)-dependent dehydrogenase (short-subunit alcohol dehydrogenase family)